MLDRTSLRGISQIGLIEEIASSGCVVVRGKIDARFFCVHGSGDKVLIHLLVSAEQRAIVKVDTAELVIDYCGEKAHPSVHKTFAGIAEER